MTSSFLQAPLTTPYLSFISGSCAHLRSLSDVRAPGVRSPRFLFQQRDLDTVLYGYSKSVHSEDGGRGHALSGLKVSQLSYGKSPYSGSL